MRKILVYASLLALLDQITKALAVKYVAGEPITIIKNFFLLEYSENNGIAFGLDMPFLLTIILNILLIPAIIYFVRKEFKLESGLPKAVTALILGGAFGNFIDRITHKYVVDFIAIGPWPNFNLADAYISIGVLLIILFHGRILRSQINKDGRRTNTTTG